MNKANNSPNSETLQPSHTQACIPLRALYQPLRKTQEIESEDEAQARGRSLKITAKSGPKVMDLGGRLKFVLRRLGGVGGGSFQDFTNILLP